jgi:small subunit ribosomal protein S16
MAIVVSKPLFFKYNCSLFIDKYAQEEYRKMVVIRLARTGAKKRPFYHVVVKHKLSARDGGCIERLGYFNPIARGGEIRLKLDLERIQYWTGVGAQTSDRVGLLVKELKKMGERTGSEYLAAKKPRKKAAAVEATPEQTSAASEDNAQSAE